MAEVLPSQMRLTGEVTHHLGKREERSPAESLSGTEIGPNAPASTPEEPQLGQYSGGVPRVKGKAINRSGTVAKCRLRPQQGTGGFFICLRSLEVAEQEEIL